jgi:hypothetical protein
MTDAEGRHTRRGLIGSVTGPHGRGMIVAPALALWLVAPALAGPPLARSLTDAHDNDSAPWLPGSAGTCRGPPGSAGVCRGLPGSAGSTQALVVSTDFRPERTGERAGP